VSMTANECARCKGGMPSTHRLKGLFVGIHGATDIKYSLSSTDLSQIHCQLSSFLVLFYSAYPVRGMQDTYAGSYNGYRARSDSCVIPSAQFTAVIQGLGS